MSGSGPVLNQLDLVVADMEKALAFYRLLGLDIPEDTTSKPWGDHHVEVVLANGFELAFDSFEMAEQYNAAARPPAAGSAVLGFRLPTREDVDALHDVVKDAGHAIAQVPYDAFWGARYAIVIDPDGNHVGLMSPRDPARRSAPPKLS